LNNIELITDRPLEVNLKEIYETLFETSKDNWSKIKQKLWQI